TVSQATHHRPPGHRRSHRSRLGGQPPRRTDGPRGPGPGGGFTMDRFWRVVACCVVLVSLSFAAFASLGVAGAADPASTAAAGNAVGWLKTQQQSDGGFELAGFPGFETPDAILAIAENAQTGSTWSTAQALAAVQAVHVGGGSGLTPLDAIDAFAHTAISPQQAAKLIVLVAAPLGLDAGAFHPGSGGTPP